MLWAFLAFFMIACQEAKQEKEETKDSAQEETVGKQSAVESSQKETSINEMESEEDESESVEQEDVQEGKAVYVYSASSDGFVNIRKEPSAKSDVVGGLVNQGPGAKLLERNGNWYKVDYDGKVGYVNSKYVAVGDREGVIAASKPAASNQQKVYYVVMGSWDSLKKAKEHYMYVPDVLDCSPIYKAVSKGKVVYRMCLKCYRSKAKAMEMVRETKEKLMIDTWIWESQGLADCVYCPLGYDGEVVKPLQPI